MPFLPACQLSPSLFSSVQRETGCISAELCISRSSVQMETGCISAELCISRWTIDEICSALWSTTVFTIDLVNAIFNWLEVELGVYAILIPSHKIFSRHWWMLKEREREREIENAQHRRETMGMLRLTIQPWKPTPATALPGYSLSGLAFLYPLPWAISFSCVEWMHGPRQYFSSIKTIA